MRFDASLAVQQLVRKTTATDPRMIRCGVLKMRKRLKDIVHVKQTVEWQRQKAGVRWGKCFKGKMEGVVTHGMALSVTHTSNLCSTATLKL